MRTTHFFLLLAIGIFFSCQNPSSDILFVNGGVYPMTAVEHKAEALAIPVAEVLDVLLQNDEERDHRQLHLVDHQGHTAAW